MPGTTVSILTNIDAAPEAVVRSLMALRRTSTPIVYLHHPDDEPPRGPDVTPLPTTATTLGGMIEAVRAAVDADLYLWIPPGVEVDPDGLEAFAGARHARPSATLFVSDYRAKGATVSIHPLTDDLTEREDFGAVWGVPGPALETVGGVDPDLRFATFYDLRLKLMEHGPVHHIDRPTHTVPQPEDENGDSAKANALFYPGKGAYGGFSYLFMDPEEEAEVEQVFYACLKRRGAFLEERSGPAPRSEVAEGDPVISVIIPVHNRAKLLPKAIESVLANTLQDFEVIVVDNASRDDSRAVAEQYAEKDSRVRVLVSEVNLIAKALNMGIAAARGRYIAQLDSDDEYVAHTLESMVNHYKANPECALAISYYELMDEDGTTLKDFGIIKHLEYNINNILRVDGAGALRCWSKAAIEEMGGFHESDFPNYGEDYDLVLKVGEHYRVDRVHDVLYRYRRHPGNTDALRVPSDKIEAKTLARTRAIQRRRKLNGLES